LFELHVLTIFSTYHMTQPRWLSTLFKSIVASLL